MDANEMDAEVIDRDRIEVFVSSSMSDEGDFRSRRKCWCKGGSLASV